MNSLSSCKKNKRKRWEEVLVFLTPSGYCAQAPSHPSSEAAFSPRILSHKHTVLNSGLVSCWWLVVRESSKCHSQFQAHLWTESCDYRSNLLLLCYSWGISQLNQSGNWSYVAQRRPRPHPVIPVPSQRWSSWNKVDDPNYEHKLAAYHKNKKPLWERCVLFCTMKWGRETTNLFSTIESFRMPSSRTTIMVRTTELQLQLQTYKKLVLFETLFETSIYFSFLQYSLFCVCTFALYQNRFCCLWAS